MRLVKPEYSRQLADTLRHDREERERASDNIDGNPTGCGIQLAVDAPGLTSLADLPSWADGVRRSACSR
jgi:hypothetical protein